MSSTIKLRCLDNLDQNLFLVDSLLGVINNSTNPSANSSTGSLLSNGGISISKTSNSSSVTQGGALTIAGGASILKDVYVGGNLTVLGTQTTIVSQIVNISDNVIIVNSSPSETRDAGILFQRYQIDNDGGFGDIVIDTPTFTTNIISNTSNTVIFNTSASSSDNTYNNWFIKITSGPGLNQVRQITNYIGSTRTATINTPWTTQLVNGNTVDFFNKIYVSQIYNEESDHLVFGYTNKDPTTSSVSISEYANLKTGSISIFNTTESIGIGSGGSLTILGGASIQKKLYVGSDLSIANTCYANTLYITNGNLLNSIITNSSIANSFLQNSSITNLTTSNGLFSNSTIGTLNISSLLSSTSILSTNNTFTNLTNTNISSGTINVSILNSINNILTNSTINNSILTNVISTNLTSSNLLSTNITSTNIISTNGTFTNTTSSNSILTNVTSNNIISSNITTSSLISNNGIITNITTTNAFMTDVIMTNITSSNLIISNMTSQNIISNNITSSSILVSNLNNTNSTITNLNLTTLSSGTILSSNMTILNEVVTNSTISNLKTDSVSVSNLFVTNITSGILVSNLININNTTNAIGIGTGGSFTALGGGSFSKDLYIGGSLYVNGQNSTTISGSISVGNNSGTGVYSLSNNSIGKTMNDSNYKIIGNLSSTSNNNNVFTVSFKNLTTTSFDAVIYRIDSLGSGWTDVNLQLNWQIIP
jgi:hypothetical protein